MEIAYCCVVFKVDTVMQRRKGQSMEVCVSHFSTACKRRATRFLCGALEDLPGEGTAAERGGIVLIREDGSRPHHSHPRADHQHALRGAARGERSEPTNNSHALRRIVPR